MTVELAARFLMWCTVINYAVLIVWFASLLVAGRKIFSLHARLFTISNEAAAKGHFYSMAVYKIGTMLFNLVPLIVVKWLM